MSASDLLTLTEARAALPLPSGDTSKDSDLSGYYIPAVTAIVEEIAGPIVNASWTRSFDGGDNSIVLPIQPVVSVDSVTESGVTLTVNNDFVVDTNNGIVYRGTYNSPRPFFWGRQNISVSWTVGIANSTMTVPINVKLAARIILAALYRNEEQGFRPAYGGPDQSGAPGPLGFSVPKRARTLLEGMERLPGIA